MATILLSAVSSLGSALGVAGTTAGVASSGLSLGSILQGTIGVLGVLSEIGAGNAEAERLELQALDAEREQPLETLQGIERRSSIKRAMVDAIGAQDVAYAASGLDLSFGTAAQARKEAFREADLALTADAGTEQTRVARLAERAANYRSAAKRARRAGLISGIFSGGKILSDIADRGA